MTSFFGFGNNLIFWSNFGFLGGPVEVKNLEPEKCLGWDWVKWDEFIQKDGLFYPVVVLKELGHTDLEFYKK